MPSNDAQALAEWVTAVAREFGLEEPLDSLGVVDLVLDLTSDVAHGVSRPGAPVTAFLVGVAAGRADDSTVAAATTRARSASWPRAGVWTTSAASPRTTSPDAAETDVGTFVARDPTAVLRAPHIEGQPVTSNTEVTFVG